MSTLHITFSNSIERLMKKFSALLQQPLPNDDILAPEWVLLDNQVLGQWLNLQLAQQQGIATNIHYIQPSAFFWELARALVAGDVPKHSPFAKDNMAWQLMAILQDEALLNSAAMQPVKAYLSGEKGQLKHYQLALRIADLFDQYLIYRPEWIQQWSSNKPFSWKASIATQAKTVEAWQQLLWQQVLARSKSPQWNRAEVLDRILAQLKQGHSLRLPMQRLVVVGISTLPPSMVEILTQLGKHIDVHLLVLNPCQEFWFDIKSAKTWAKTAFALQSRLRLQTYPEDLLIGNPLLAANGQEVREFIETLIEREGEHVYIEEEYVEPPNDTLLHSIQRDILNMVYAGDQPSSMAPYQDDSLDKTPLPLLPKQHNVQLHICHGRMREVEVLHNQLLRLLNNDSTLMPRDIVVMMPDASQFVPYIETVFSATQDTLPYQIADKTWLEDSPILRSIESLLGLSDSYFGLSEIIALLEVEAIRAKFAIDAAGFETLKKWLQDSGARWGVDAKHRETHGLPAYSDFSWEFAWHRLMAGYAMNAVEQGGELLAIDNGWIDPFDAVEGSNTELLNGFYNFWQRLIYYKKQLAQKYTLLEWSVNLQVLLDDFYVQNEANHAALKMLRKECENLKKFEQEYTAAIDIAVIRDWIKPLLNQASRSRNPWQEGIKFCSLMPMRAVPFRVVYLMGMNQADYPKQESHPLFDLMRYDYRAGDRSRRVGDRWLFLEALLSARDALLISYSGRDARNNEERNPSVVVTELMDYLNKGYRTADNTAVMSHLTTEHKLQPFSKEYFLKDNAFFSYNAQAFAMANASAVSKAEENVDSSLVEQQANHALSQNVTIDLSAFIQFFTEPAKWFFKYKYSTWLAIENAVIDDDELFNLPQGLGDWQLRDAMRHYVQANPDVEEDCEIVLDHIETLWKAQGLWPLGAAGDALKQKTLAQVKPDWLFAVKRIGLPVSVQAIDYRLTNNEKNLHIQGALLMHGTVHCVHSASKQKSKNVLETAIKVALLSVQNSSASEVKVITFDERIKAGMREIAYRVQPNQQHEIFLRSLANLYWQYQHSGLPYDIDLAQAIINEESLNNIWAGGYSDGGLQQNPDTRFYYNSLQHLQAEQFSQVAEQMHNALSQWQEENTDIASKKSTKKAKEVKNGI